MMVLLILLHLFASLILILVVLLQSGKAADLAGAFGGAGSQTAFGARGGQSFLAKATTGAAILFMITSLALGILSSRKSLSVLENQKEPAPQEQTAPALPEGATDQTPLPSDVPETDPGAGGAAPNTPTGEEAVPPVEQEEGPGN
ncbi:MAG: preprotein translocase subunit SecG [Acidobacteria bacterium]|nr:preprotein translocase subunit SecG [Acidobacteriota bacterium]